MGKRVLEMIPATGRAALAICEAGGRYSAELALDCAAHERTETVYPRPDRIMGDEYRAIASAALACVLEDREEYRRLRREIIEPSDGWWAPIPLDLPWLCRAYGILARYYRVAFGDPYATLRRLIETPARVRHSGWSEDWDIYLPWGEKVDCVRIDREIQCDLVANACRGLVLVPCVASVARSCYEFRVLCRAAWNAARAEAHAARFPYLVGGAYLYPILAAVSRGVLHVLENIDDVLLS